MPSVTVASLLSGAMLTGVKVIPPGSGSAVSLISSLGFLLGGVEVLVGLLQRGAAAFSSAANLSCLALASLASLAFGGRGLQGIGQCCCAPGGGGLGLGNRPFGLLYHPLGWP